MPEAQHEVPNLEYRSELKEESLKAAQHYLADDATQEEGMQILQCAERLKTCVRDGQAIRIDTWYCKHPQCPTCQYRRALRYCSRMHRLFDQYPKLANGKWLFLTLTVRNCFADDLRVTIQAMNRAFARLMSRVFWKHNVRGGIRHTEVIPGKADKELVHPHFHCLLLVTPSMHEGKNYISMKRWAEEWQRALQVHYLPEVDCKRLNAAGGDLKRQIISLARYSMKPQRVPDNRCWFHSVAFETRRLRRFQPFGEIKELLGELSEERATNSTRYGEQITSDSNQSIWSWDAWSSSYRSNEP